MKAKIAIIGKGNIGWAIKQLLKDDYEIKHGDITEGLDAHDINQVREFLKDTDAVISAGPFAINKNIGTVAAEMSIGYFDLTEDVETTEFIRNVKSKSVMMPQCGLAPGAINICAAGMIEKFDNVKEVMMRVGALPRFTNNEMSYYLSWSTNGLINEYCNEADAIYEGKPIKVMPLEGAEKLTIEGESYEAFNTSGGCATMCETYENKVENLSYKTIRYPGHLNHMKFLFNDLHLKKNKDVLEKLFDKEVPRTTNDVIVFYVKVIGEIDEILQERTYLKKIYGDEKFSAIQRTTASGVCSVLDMYVNGKIKSKGFIKQESVSWNDFIDNKFGKVYI
jgi:saccharopine dehydrogenase-like NADP-dependent oxidoreductase